MSKRIKTAISGSLPKPAWLAEPEKLWAPWQLQGEALAQAKTDAMRLAVDDQRESSRLIHHHSDSGGLQDCSSKLVSQCQLGP
jgi:5-methyltetrahydropteroyltriglutamate--homocysteine methyltransferase